MERHTGKRQPKYHAGRGPNHDSPAAHDIDVFQSDKGEEKVRSCYDQPHSRRLVKANRLEERS